MNLDNEANRLANAVRRDFWGAIAVIRAALGSVRMAERRDCVAYLENAGHKDAAAILRGK